jgi:hypothetical protein
MLGFITAVLRMLARTLDSCQHTGAVEAEMWHCYLMLHVQSATVRQRHHFVTKSMTELMQQACTIMVQMMDYSKQ